VNSNEFFRISQCESAKEMWDTLEVIHEGTNENEEKVLNMLFKKLRKFLKKRINKRDSSKRYDNKNSTKVKTNNYAYLEYGEQGYTKAKRLNKEEKKGKSRKTCNNESSSTSSSEVGKANLCLMDKKEYDSRSESSVSSCASLNAENYSQLLQAFKETHEEANRLALLNNRLKGMNNWLENRVKALEEELGNSKTDFENLEMLYKNSSCKCDSLVCENCESLEKKVHYLVKTVDKLSKGKSNFESVLASQNCVFGKVGLSFNPQNKFSNSF